MDLNYKHLRYFREVARDGNLTRTAERINLSQSALSMQIRTLEERLGHALFERTGRKLLLTEVGRIALDYADRIFDAGDELLATLDHAGANRPPLRVGAASTLSRNFQMRFLAPALDEPLPVVLRSGPDAQLLSDLRDLALDVVLSTEAPRDAADFIAHRLAEQPVRLHGLPGRVEDRDLPELLSSGTFVVPTEPAIRTGFSALSDRLGVTPRIAAEVDDMAMVRLLARAGAGIAVAPSVVVADELASGRLATAPLDTGIVETFFAVTVPRAFPHPSLDALIAAARDL